MSRLQILNKSYTTSNHVKKILRSLSVRYIPKVTAIQEAKDMKKISIESRISNLKSHELELNGDEEPIKKSRSMALKSIGRSNKSSMY